MKKILTALLLVFSLLFTSCDLLPQTSQDSNGAQDNENNGDSTSEDINSPCPGGNGNTANNGNGDSSSSDNDEDSSDENNSKDEDNPSDDNNGKDEDNPSDDNNSKDEDKPSDDNNSEDEDKPSDDNNGKDEDKPSDDNNGKDEDKPSDDNNGEDKPSDENNVTSTHADADNNGQCDKCGITVTVEVNFFVLNDFHGKIADSDTQPGADELSLYLKTLKTTYSNSILLASGDMWQGGAESNLTKGLLVTEWMNELDFTSMTLGNHEYDWGEEYIIRNSEHAEFPLLAINVYDRATNKRVEYCAPSVTVDLGNIQIGIIGAIGDCYSSISSDKTQDVYFKTGSDLTALVKEEADKLRANGVDFIVYSLHDGYGSSTSATTIADNKILSYYDTALSIGGYVDVVFEGHTHQTYAFADSYGVYHVQGGGDNKGFSHVSITLNFANGNDKTDFAKVVLNSVYRDLEDDPYIAELLEKYAEELEKGNEYIGYNPSYVSGYTLRQIVADLYYALGEEAWGDEYDIVLGGGYISTRSPYNLYAGDVYYSDLLMLFPFDNPIMLCSIKGYYLRKKFIETNNSDYYICYGEYGERVKGAIDDNATYYVIVDSYTAQYAPNKLTVIKTYDAVTFARDLLAKYIKNGGLN